MSETFSTYRVRCMKCGEDFKGWHKCQEGDFVKGDRWTPSRKRASSAFERYIRHFHAYTARDRQIAESAFHHGFRSGVVFVEGEYRALVKRSAPVSCNCKEIGGACSDCFDGPVTDIKNIA